jgi:hypothetical protein
MGTVVAHDSNGRRGCDYLFLDRILPDRLASLQWSFDEYDYQMRYVSITKTEKRTQHMNMIEDIIHLRV